MVRSGKRALHTMLRVYHNYIRHSGPMMAAAIAFYAILSIVPILSLGVALLGMALGSSSGALDRVTNAIKDALPVSGDVVSTTLDQIRRTSGLASVVSLVGLLLPGSAIFGTMEAAFHQMRGGGAKRKWLARRIVALVLAAVTLVLLLASVAVTSVVAWVQSVGSSMGIWRGLQPRLVPLEAQAATLAVSVLMFALIYRFLPTPPIPWRRAIRGAVFAGVAWEFAKYLFSLYVRSLGHFNRIYGPLGAIVSLMVWALYSAVILLLGAELAADAGDDGAQDPAVHNG
ncbi:MAG: YihY/virulence factor BrkB family protein [Chthonomonadales bacterium]